MEKEGRKAEGIENVVNEVFPYDISPLPSRSHYPHPKITISPKNEKNKFNEKEYEDHRQFPYKTKPPEIGKRS
jgi:hypothetical protein